MFCPSCGERNEATARVCADCGLALPRLPGDEAVPAPLSPPRILKPSRPAPLAPPSLDAVPRAATPRVAAMAPPSFAPPDERTDPHQSGPGAPRPISLGPQAPMPLTVPDGPPSPSRMPQVTLPTLSPVPLTQPMSPSYEPPPPPPRRPVSPLDPTVVRRAPAPPAQPPAPPLTQPMAQPTPPVAPASPTPAQRMSPPMTQPMADGGALPPAETSAFTARFGPGSVVNTETDLEAPRPSPSPARAALEPRAPTPRTVVGVGARPEPRPDPKPFIDETVPLPAARPADVTAPLPTARPVSTLPAEPAAPRAAPPRPLRLAGFVRRGPAAVVDAALALGGAVGLLALWLSQAGQKLSLQSLIDRVLSDLPAGVPVVVGAPLLSWFVLQSLAFVLRGTIGMRLTGTRLVRRNGERVGLVRALLRAAISTMGLALCGASFAWALWLDRERRGFGDVVARTIVVVGGRR